MTETRNDWGDGERGETEPEAAPQLTPEQAKAFPLGGDWGVDEGASENDEILARYATADDMQTGTSRQPDADPNESGDDPIAYLGELPESFDDDDREVVSHFFSGLEGQVSPELAQQILSRYDELSDAQQGIVKEEDHAAAKSAAAALKESWGEDYQANKESLKAAIMSEPFAEDLLDARFSDGTAIFNDPKLFEWLHGMARDQAKYREMVERFGED